MDKSTNEKKGKDNKSMEGPIYFISTGSENKLDLAWV